MFRTLLALPLLATLSLYAHDTVHAQTAPGNAFRDCQNCPDMIVIPPGSYIKGSPPGEAQKAGAPDRDARNETPQENVSVTDPFAVSIHEITRAQFADFVAEAGYDPDWECLTWDFEYDTWGARDTIWSWDNPGFEQGPDHPVVCVSFTDATAYVDWLSQQTGQSYRLLTDIEWEWIARDNTQTMRPWPNGEDLSIACTYANVTDLDSAATLKIDESDPENFVFPCRDGFGFTAPVGSFPANGYGVHDTIGNAWEWVEGCMFTVPEDGGDAVENCDERLMRGGAWQAKSWYLRPAKRDWAPFWLRSARIGLRVARDL